MIFTGKFLVDLETKQLRISKNNSSAFGLFKLTHRGEEVTLIGIPSIEIESNFNEDKYYEYVIVPRISFFFQTKGIENNEKFVDMFLRSYFSKPVVIDNPFKENSKVFMYPSIKDLKTQKEKEEYIARIVKFFASQNIFFETYSK